MFYFLQSTIVEYFDSVKFEQIKLKSYTKVTVNGTTWIQGYTNYKYCTISIVVLAPYFSLVTY